MNSHHVLLLLSLSPLACALAPPQESTPPVEAADAPSVEEALVEEPVALASQALFSDATEALGLGPGVVPEQVARVVFCDLDDDGWPDLVVDKHRVFLNRPSEGGRIFEEHAGAGLDPPRKDTVTVFADLDGDRLLDALVAERVDARKAGWEDHGRRTRWQRGKGDGGFEEAQALVDVLAATTISIAISDVDRDGHLDLWLGNWYTDYGATYGGYQNQLLLGRGVVDGELRFESRLLPVEDSGEGPSLESDPNGRPTFGTRIADLDGDGTAELIELNYGRRGNRLWQSVLGAEGDGGPVFADIAPPDTRNDWYLNEAWDRYVGFDGDRTRHGRYPDWAVEAFAKREPPIERLPEDRFRSHGNSFDVAVADVDRDGVLDAFVSEITHGWAGDSSDRSRLLLFSESGPVELRYPTAYPSGPAWSVDRIPDGVNSWNQGDLFCELADLDLDGFTDLLLSSGDYPDDQRLRFYRNGEGAGFTDATADAGLDHDGSQQLSLADYDGDGDLDFAVGQTFFRYTAAMKAGRSPRLRVLENQAEGRSLVLRLAGDGKTVNHHALGARVRATLADGSVLLRELEAIGGHSGKQHGFELHLGLGDASDVELLEVWWPDAERTYQAFEGVGAGRYRLAIDGELQPL